MPRQKNEPDVVSRKMDLAQRLKQIRLELFGHRGGPELARRLNLPTRTWYNYEKGVTIPGEILLDFLLMTQVPLESLLTCIEEKPGLQQRVSLPGPLKVEPSESVESNPYQLEPVRKAETVASSGQMVVQTTDGSMLPSLPPGTLIGLGDSIEPSALQSMEGQIVVAWQLETPIVRRLLLQNERWVLEADQAGWPATDLPLAINEFSKLQRVLWLLRPSRLEKRLALVHEES